MLLKNTYSIVFSILFVGASVYTLMIYTLGTAGSPMLSEEAAKGKLLYQEYNCQSCHQLYGLGGYMGPDLTNVISSPGKGELYARAIISSGTARMPNFHMSEAEITQLTAYLKHVDKTGRSPLYVPKLTLWGTVEEPNTNHKPELTDAK